MTTSIYERAAAALRPTGVDLSPVLDAISAIDLPVVDLSPVIEAVNAIEMPGVDLTPVLQSLETLRDSVDLGSVLAAIEQIDIPDVNLSAIESSLNTVQSNLTNGLSGLQDLIGNVPAPEVDLQPVISAISEVDSVTRGHSASWDEFITAVVTP